MTCPTSAHDLATRLARVGIDQDPAHGAVMPPLHLSANYSWRGNAATTTAARAIRPATCWARP